MSTSRLLDAEHTNRSRQEPALGHMRSQNSPAVGGFPSVARRPTVYSSLFVCLGLTFQIFLPDVNLLFQLIGQYQQVPVNHSIAVGWNARNSSQELSLLAKLLNTDHVLNTSHLSAPTLKGRPISSEQRSIGLRSRIS